MFGPRALAAGEEVLRLLTAAGSTRVAAARTLYTVLMYTIGFAALDAAELPPGGRADMAQRVAERRAEFAVVPAEEFPLTRASAATMATYVTDTQFRSGLDAIIAGVGSGV